MLHSGCVKLHQKFRDFVGLPMGLLREESPKNRMNTGLFGSRSGGVRSEGCTSCSPVLQALIIFQYALLRLCFGRAVFCCPFPGEQGSTTAHLRRLPREGRAGGAYKTLLKHRVLKQKAWFCVYSANFL